MDDSEAGSLEQTRAFLAGSGEVRFAGLRRAEVYAWVERTLVRHEYAGLVRAASRQVVRTSKYPIHPTHPIAIAGEPAPAAQRGSF